MNTLRRTLMRMVAAGCLCTQLSAAAAWAQPDGLAADPPTAGPSQVSPTPASQLPATSATQAEPRVSGMAVTWAVLVYLSLLLLFRQFTIAAPARSLLLSQIDGVALKLKLEGGPTPTHEIRELTKELEDIRRAQVWTWFTYIREPLFWSGGRELAAWRRLHEIERHLVTVTSPSERVIQRAIAIEADLRSKGSNTATMCADRIRRTLDQPPPSRSIQTLRFQLGEALMVSYGDRDATFASLMEWHNKAMWMVTVALMVIVALTLVFGQFELFLIGAAGGLMSRMTRSLVRADVPTDYGASWTTLFLSPLLGAIAAWFGIAAIDLLSDLQVLGGVFAAISWGGPVANGVTLIVAFLLGFSERLFLSLLSAVEGRVQTQIKESEARQSAPVAAPPAAASTVAAPARDREAVPLVPIAASLTTGVVDDLDLVAGERAVFVGDTASPLRLILLGAAGPDRLVDTTLENLGGVGDADAILVEHVPGPAKLAALAADCARVLRVDGRVVVVGMTPAGLFDADAASQERNQVAGPALVNASMTSAGLLAQEPAERLAGPDPVRWSAAFKKPSV